MLKPELYEKTVSILVQAYLNDTLEHGDCCGCAVGNMVAANCGYSFIKLQNYQEWESNSPCWDDVFCTARGKQELHMRNYRLSEEARKQIDSTGYSVRQLAKIEFAFETAPYGDSDDEWMFNGLMAVIDILDQIHGNTDTEVTTTQKNRFTKLVTA